MDEHELLQQLISDESQNRPHRGMNLDSPSPERKVNLDICQWQVEPNGVFRPSAKTVEGLPAGAYGTDVDQFGEYFRSLPLMSDNIIDLPDSVNERILRGIQKFWNSRDRYAQHGLLYKRGILLWGPPGAGKTVTIHLLARDLIERGGAVLFCKVPREMLALVKSMRKIEPNRTIIVVMEDIEEIIDTFGEHDILSMLDGENQTDNVVYVASTNYPERLGARIINRPSRFDEVVMVGMPSDEARAKYLSSRTNLGEEELKLWVESTKDFSIAHLRELVAAVFCLDQPFEKALVRLREMGKKLKDVDGFNRNKIGLR